MAVLEDRVAARHAVSAVSAAERGRGAGPERGGRDAAVRAGEAERSVRDRGAEDHARELRLAAQRSPAVRAAAGREDGVSGPAGHADGAGDALPGQSVEQRIAQAAAS